MIPRVSSSGFKRVLNLLELFGMDAQRFRRRILRLAGDGRDFPAIRGVGLRQGRRRTLELFPQPLVHARGVGRRQLALARHLIDQRPFGGNRAGLLNVLQVRLRPSRTRAEQEQQREE